MTSGLLALRDWLQELGVTYIAMEATGVYLEARLLSARGDFELLLVNAKHVKHVPGRKTDVKDAQWLSQLLEHGLLKPSFVPPAPIRELRARSHPLSQEPGPRATARGQPPPQGARGRGHKTLVGGIGRARVSGRRMLSALCEGSADAEALADLAKVRLRTKLPALREALEGRFRGHHALLVSHVLAHLDFLDETITALLRGDRGAPGPFRA